MRHFLILLSFCLMIATDAKAEFKVDLLTESHKAKLQKHLKKCNASVPLERFRIVTVSYIDFEGVSHDSGKLMVLDAVANHVLRIFQELYELKFPIAKVDLIDEFSYSDSSSMANNNTSAFNWRNIIGSKTVASMHCYGLAIDLNPVQNPYVQIDASKGVATCQPKAGIHYLNRHLYLQDNLEKKFLKKNGIAEEVRHIFAKYGFKVWGGNWKSPIDYQHFQVSRELGQALIKLDPKLAASLFEKNIVYYNQHKKELLDYVKENFQKKYPTGVENINAIIENHFEELKEFIATLRI